MKILDVLNQPWAILPEKLAEIRDIYSRHLQGEKIDIKGIEAAIGRPLNNRPQGYSVQDGVAVVPVDGVLAKKMNLFTQISGGTSTQLLQGDIAAALSDLTVHSVILLIDSGGGQVDGTQAVANFISGSRGQKPIVSLADGCCASAAYWIGSAADKVYITGDLTLVGSIGVVMTHKDFSKAEAAQGVTTTEITAGKYKRIASEHAPLTQDGRASIQEQADHIYSVFVDAVAANRGVSADVVLSDMADGRVFWGQNAVSAGLVDGVSTLDALIADLNSDYMTSINGPQTSTGAVSPKTNSKGNSIMAEETVSMTAAELKAAKDEAFKAGASAELARIQGVEAQSLAGHEALIATLKFDGHSTGPEAAVAVLAAERTIAGQRAANMRADAPAVIAPAAVDPKTEAAIAKPAAAKEMTVTEMSTKARDYVAKRKAEGKTVSYAEAIQQISAEAAE